MGSQAGNEPEVGKLVDEWVIVGDEGQELHVGMVGERTLAGDTGRFIERADGSSEIVIVGPSDAEGRRRIGLHRRPS